MDEVMKPRDAGKSEKIIYGSGIGGGMARMMALVACCAPATFSRGRPRTPTG